MASSINTASGTTSVSGLVSGLDTSSIITQLMQVEAQTQTGLKTKVTTEQSNVKSLQDLNTTFASLATQAATLAGASAWNPVSATSSSPLVSVTAGARATTGALSFTVGNVANAQQLRFTSTAALGTVVTTGSTKVRIDHLDGTTQDIETGDGTMQGLINAINGSSTGLKASTVRLDDGTYRLQVTSVATGNASDFTLKNTDGSDLLGGASVTAGQDASITIGGDTVHSASNTFAQVANGLDITLNPTVPAGTAVTVGVTQDATSMTASVKSLVDAINATLTKMDGLTDYNAATKTSGPLATDGAVRSLSNTLLDAVYPTDGTSLASVGIQLDRYGKLTFDAAAFTAAYQADPAAVAAKFTSSTATPSAGGFADRIQKVAKSASDPISGTITNSITGRNSTIKQLQDSIADWDTRLALRQQTLTTQFTAMETALQQLQSQQSWLTSQLASLPTNSSGS
ncbi:MAG: flagellar filament capping protein FliD [Marmoricola sp.]